MSGTTTIHRLTTKNMRKDLDEYMKGCSPSEDVNPNVFYFYMDFLLDEIDRLENKININKNKISSHHAVY